MQYIHVALALHSAGKDISVDNIKKMLSAVGAKSDESQIKALIAVLEDVDINEAVKSAPVMAAAPAATTSDASSSAPATKEPEEPEEPAGEDLGLDSLFG